MKGYQYEKRRRSYLSALHKVELPELFSELEKWLRSAERRPLFAAARARVSDRGEVLLNLWGRELIIWGWPLYYELRGKEILIVPWIDGETKMLIFADSLGKTWLRRFFDPEQKLFYARGRRSFFYNFIYTLALPASRVIHFLGVDLLFPMYWKVGSLVFIWVFQGKILRVSRRFRAPMFGSFRTIERDGRVTHILVSRKLPRRLLAHVSGVLDGVRIFNTARGNLKFSASCLMGKSHNISKDDARRLGISCGSVIKVLLEEGWPVAIIGPGDKRVNYLVIRDGSGKIQHTMRMRLSKKVVPDFAVIENMPLYYGRDKLPYIYSTGRRFHLDVGAGKKQRSMAFILWRRDEVLYFSARGVLNQNERAVAKELSLLLAENPDSGLADYSAYADFLRGIRKELDRKKLNPAGIAHLVKAMRRIMRRAWENYSSGRRDYAAVTAGAFRVQCVILARKLGIPL